jgi:hypothetical protein
VPDTQAIYIIVIIIYFQIKIEEDTIRIFTICKEYWQGSGCNDGILKYRKTWGC